jgi:4-hydroxybenzoate polyprenyltransferase
MPPEARPLDAAPDSFVERLPLAVRPYARLARWDRPAGIWLLAVPCWCGLALERIDTPWQAGDAWMVVLFTLGAIAMRGAGCTWNDMLDRDIDARVERTAGRPLASGQVGMRAALAWTLAQCAVGLVVLLQLRPEAQIVALLAIPLVALYPLMKRITWWPQVWLGLTFSWGALVGAAQGAGEVGIAAVLLYAGLVSWTVAYDTIYALQDVEDDALVGVRSTARRFGDAWPLACVALYLTASMAIIAALLFSAMWPPLALALGAVFFAMGAWSVARVAARREAALGIFRMNAQFGVIFAAILVLLGAR